MPHNGDRDIRIAPVRCPRDRFTIQSVQVNLMWVDGHGWLPTCNGCENLTADKVCQDCTAGIISMFFNNPDLDLSAPISPVLPKS